MLNPDIYLHDIPLGEAQAAWHAALEERNLLTPLGSESVPLEQANGRVTAQPVWARLSSPHYHASAMDGYAIRAEDTRGATETAPKQLAIGQQAIYMDTGDPIPPGFNAVVMVENAQVVGDFIEIIAPAAPWQYIRPMGEDMVATELVLAANHRIRPQDLGALAGSGHDRVTVYRRPRVAIIPTGNELVRAGVPVQAGEIIEYNSLVLGALAEEAGAEVTRYPIHPNDQEKIKQTVLEAMKTHDLVVVNAGSSAGSQDFTSRVFAQVGKIQVHGIAIRPGHPVILAVAQKALAGIPGYPVSAAVTFELLCLPLILRWQGQVAPARPHVQAKLTRKVVSPMGDDEFLRVTVGQVGQTAIATPLSGGAGVITSLVKADGVVVIPRFKEGHHAGEMVDVELMGDPNKVRNTILAIGSHDMTLDVLADELARRSAIRGRRVWLSSAHVGSYSGLMALQRGEAHFAGSHLLNEDGDRAGEYNTNAIAQLLAPFGVRVLVMGFVNRAQGLIVPRGNPKRVNALEDVARADVTFVNRQRGAGTRALLDFELKKRGIHPRQIAGYDRAEYTHLALAAQVKSGAADCGLGILAAARALELDFVPLFNERYDLIIPVEHYESALLQPMLEVIRDPAFAQRVQALGGYETGRMGVVIEG